MSTLILNYFGAATWTRTRDLRLIKAVLYQLSYRGNKYNMEKDNPGFNYLHALRHGEVTERGSFTCTKEFTLSFPKKESTEFKLDPQYPQY